jgi:hypothetical protein
MLLLLRPQSILKLIKIRNVSHTINLVRLVYEETHRGASHDLAHMLTEAHMSLVVPNCGTNLIVCIALLQLKCWERESAISVERKDHYACFRWKLLISPAPSRSYGFFPKILRLGFTPTNFLVGIYCRRIIL